ncbi:hypothetical protein C6361_09870 [Plantactinospora sp. BC1]|uniref:hypothetical protein n=1 Tax=Plantactinospora sp. BC1 TaxID=2108470 RepID=UPI000D172D29|nr:hypothetical protein [Plantactinospora sp. BC1]AVT29746.1 hypothetical protein C6361_09870 [Plantactinospora sp. BC1]
MPRTGSFRYRVHARCEPSDAMRLLGDVRRQGELHPLIVRVRPRPAGPGALRTDLVTDRLRWPPPTGADPPVLSPGRESFVALLSLAERGRAGVG